jgi:hypothetical protein
MKIYCSPRLISYHLKWPTVSKKLDHPVLNYWYYKALQIANFCKMARLFGLVGGIFGPITFSTFPATCSSKFFIVPYSALLTLYPVAFQLDTGDLHAIRQNPHRMLSPDWLLMLPVSEVSSSCGFLFFLVPSLQAFVFVRAIGWFLRMFRRC